MTLLGFAKYRFILLLNQSSDMLMGSMSKEQKFNLFNARIISELNKDVLKMSLKETDLVSCIIFLKFTYIFFNFLS